MLREDPLYTEFLAQAGDFAASWPGVEGASLQVDGLLLHDRRRLSGSRTGAVAKTQPVAGFVINNHVAIFFERTAAGIPGWTGVLPAIEVNYYVRTYATAPH